MKGGKNMESKKNVKKVEQKKNFHRGIDITNKFVMR